MVAKALHCLLHAPIDILRESDLHCERNEILTVLHVLEEYRFRYRGMYSLQSSTAIFIFVFVEESNRREKYFPESPEVPYDGVV